MKKTTLGNFLCESLSNTGMTEIFGVAGDYNFTILDEIAKHPKITFVENRNELNAGYAADAYARLKGLGAIVTTFGVGELSACNAIAGSNSENVPVIHIVGAPPVADQQGHKLMHHSLMDGNFNLFQEVYGKIAAYTTSLTVDNAATEIPKAIHIAQTTKKPVYIAIPDELIAKEITVDTVQLPTSATSQTSLQQAIAHANQLLSQSNNTVLLSDVKAMRFGLQEPVKQLVEKMNIPVANTVFGKGSFDETHPNYIGVYAGDCGEESVKNMIETAECTIAIGLVWADTNTASFSAKVDFTTTIQIQPNSVKIGEALYQNVKAEDMINGLIQLNKTQTNPVTVPAFPYSQENAKPEDKLQALNYYPIFEAMLKENDNIVVETGTLLDGFSQVRLPKNATYITQGGYQSIGYATPATFGACIANPNKRTILFTGDGSFQLTAQELSSMLAKECKPIIFILNNGKFVVEQYLNVKTDNQKYNKIPNWNYTKLPEAFRGEAFTATVTTVGELKDAITKAETESQNKLCLIEIVPEDPMDAPAYLAKSRTILQAQDMNK